MTVPVDSLLATLTTPDWLEAAEVAERMRCSVAHVRRRSRASWGVTRGRGPRLHGHHTTNGAPGGRWRHRADVVEACLQGLDHAAQVRICGCQRLVAVPA